MKYLFLILILSGCGGASPSSSSGGSPASNNPSTHLYRLVVSGDNVAFVGQIFTDLEQANPGPQIISPGQTIILQATVNSANTVYVLRTNTSGVPLNATLFIDGIQVATSPALYNNTEYQNFGAF